MAETIKELEATIEDIQKERAKTRPRAKAYSSRQEADKKAAGGRVAYIKERQRKRAVEHRHKTGKERMWLSKRKLKDASFGIKDRVFPLAEGQLAEDEQCAPMHQRERAFIKNKDD